MWDHLLVIIIALFVIILWFFTVGS